jgi:xanthine dehydrogenase accessory factor
VPLVSVLGDSPIASALRDVAASLGYEGAAYSSGDLASADAVVVATHGKKEEETLEAAVRAGVPYVGLIASPKRGSAVVGSLDLTDEAKARIHYPAGLDIGARTPAEIALSVFAQMVSERPREPRAPRDPQHLPGEPPMTRTGLLTVLEADTSIDPVCGMTVTIDADALFADVDGERVYFCCPACRRAYVADPGKYPRS